ncbi:MAG: hypothetical protein ACRD0D_11550 [Acidimicrobiales bacterium]
MLIGMPEFVVRAAVDDSGEVWVPVETPPGPVHSPGWGARLLPTAEVTAPGGRRCSSEPDRARARVGAGLW